MTAPDYMHNEPVNLLPEDRQRALRYDYFMRIGVVAIALFIALSFAAAILLVPSYVFLVENKHAKEAQLANVESVLSSSGKTALSAQLAALSDDTATLQTLATAPSVSVAIRKALAISRSGITLSGFIYSSGVNQNPNTLAISGVAATRDALRRYQLALQSAPFAQSADLPISTYAEDANIAFTITITLAP
jgi:Tfp pilus assembly protein PilN